MSFQAFAKITSSDQAKQWLYELQGWVFIYPKWAPMPIEEEKLLTFKEALDQVSPREIMIKN